MPEPLDRLPFPPLSQEELNSIIQQEKSVINYLTITLIFFIASFVYLLVSIFFLLFPDADSSSVEGYLSLSISFNLMLLTGIVISILMRYLPSSPVEYMRQDDEADSKEIKEFDEVVASCDDVSTQKMVYSYIHALDRPITKSEFKRLKGWFYKRLNDGGNA